MCTIYSTYIKMHKNPLIPICAPAHTENATNTTVFIANTLWIRTWMGDGTKKVLFISEMAQLKGIFLILYAAVRLKYAAVMVHVGPEYSYFDKKSFWWWIWGLYIEKKRYFELPERSVWTNQKSFRWRFWDR